MGVAALFVLAYLAAAVNFAIVVLHLLGKADPRTQFSGNAGTTNVFRQAGRGWAAVVLLLDVGRAVGFAALALWLLPFAWAPWIGFALVLGNRFPCFHGFRGGKGVANYLGFTVLIAPWGAALSCLVWVVVHRIVRIPFVASFFMILTLGGATVAASGGQAIPIAGTAATALFVFWNHRGNVAALLDEIRGKAGG